MIAERFDSSLQWENRTKKYLRIRKYRENGVGFISLIRPFLSLYEIVR